MRLHLPRIPIHHLIEDMIINTDNHTIQSSSQVVQKKGGQYEF
jgi:hypothetical protein